MQNIYVKSAYHPCKRLNADVCIEYHFLENTELDRSAILKYNCKCSALCAGSDCKFANQVFSNVYVDLMH